MEDSLKLLVVSNQEDIDAESISSISYRELEFDYADNLTDSFNLLCDGYGQKGTEKLLRVVMGEPSDSAIRAFEPFRRYDAVFLGDHIHGDQRGQVSSGEEAYGDSYEARNRLLIFSGMIGMPAILFSRNVRRTIDEIESWREPPEKYAVLDVNSGPETIAGTLEELLGN
ncbi:hypothetical protein GF386_04250 [Candidatus Pacearchaeota archaeon]|nr:hypothetical protein [Candidatus Pacearchaeota archaeon]MBD3283336.1 hypothetical protein [Candidatus Pacearchaeota archaeon]